MWLFSWFKGFSRKPRPSSLDHRTDMAPNIRRVAVIGAGPSGAIATDALVKEQAFDVVKVFDRRAGVGGTW